VYQAVTNTAVNGGSTSNLTGNVFVPAATENYTHDLDGNVSVDGRWTFMRPLTSTILLEVAEKVVPNPTRQGAENLRKESRHVHHLGGTSKTPSGKNATFATSPNR
jgi:hypothetical protein